MATCNKTVQNTTSGLQNVLQTVLLGFVFRTELLKYEDLNLSSYEEWSCVTYLVGIWLYY